jgi:ATP-binding cassette, subfamily B, bacterial
MEPTQNDKIVFHPSDQTNRERDTETPPILSRSSLYKINKIVPLEVPIAGLPILSSEDFQWHTLSSQSSSASIPTPLAQTKIDNTKSERLFPSPPIPNIPASQRIEYGQLERQAPLILPAPPHVSVGVSSTQSTGMRRWEHQTSRYPAELIALMESETREMQALGSQPPVDDQPAKRLRRKQRRVPEMRQMTAVECGAACLAMILNYYGYSTSISEVQEHCGVGRDGLTALEIVKSARLYGLRVRTVSVTLNDFRYVTLPAIVHWEFNHFMLVERRTSKGIDVVDPALGRRRLSLEEFDEGFTGIAIMLEPRAQFKQRASQKVLTPWAYMRSLLSMRSIITQVIGASLLLQLLGLGVPVLTEIVIDRILPQKDPNLLTILGLGMLILVFMQGIAIFLRSSLLIYLQTRIDTNMMLNFFEHMLSLPYRFFQLRLNGDLLARMNSNLAIRDLLTNQLISTLLDGSTVIIYFIILLIFSKFIALIALAIGIVQVILLLVTAPAIRRLTQRDLEAQGKTQGYMSEILAGIATLKAAGAEHRAFDRWENLFFDEMNISLRLSYLSSVISAVIGILNLLAPLLLLWFGAMQVIDGTMTIGTMLAFNTLAISFLIPLGSLASSVQELQVVRAHFSRVADVIGTDPEQDPAVVKTPHRLQGYIELRHVGFRYNQNAPHILRDINAKIYPGQKVALVGKTGSGKSTLGKLLVGLIPPTNGSILYDGIPLESLNYQEVRSQFGVVLQESFIFSGSVRENIALNNPDMDLNRIIEASRLAVIDEDIAKMPMGYDTLVSEGGSAFSGGQRQRVALARALAHHPALLLLDEATSALDVMTEQAVEQNLSRLPCTQIIIAHRLSTIRNADVILVLDRGHIVEMGNHQQLLQKSGFYAHLIQTQVQNGNIAGN